jgi:DNA polymerase-1
LRVICDIECDSLTPTRIWVIVCKDIDNGKVYTFLEPDRNPKPWLEFAESVDLWIGHNFLGFDACVLNRFFPGSIPLLSCVDTLVVSRLLNYNIAGGHSLRIWAKRLGLEKIEFNEWDKLTPEMIEYCQKDVEINYALWKHFERYIYDPNLKDALRLEHNIALIAEDMHNNGFKFKIEEARELHKQISEQVDELTKELQQAFPPKSKLIREITPKSTKHGTLSRTDFRWEGPNLCSYTAGWSFSRFEWQDFNPGSPKDRIDVLWDAKWQPFEKTKGHKEAERSLRDERDAFKRRELTDKLANHYARYGWTCSEENLGTLPPEAPEAARKLVRWLLVNSRRSTLEEWFNAFSEATGCIHGRFLHIGAWTGRMAHQGPNMGNVPSVDPKYNNPELKAIATEFGKQMRALWVVPEDKVLVGCDADGIQLRILAHYMNDLAFTEALINGDKDKGTDAHTLNKLALGDVCKSRAVAKTFIYAWLLGAGIAKVASILGCSNGEAREAVEKFVDNYPGLKYLKNTVIPRDAKRGYFIGLDGRLVPCSSEHHMLGGYLQNGEATLMKRACIKWRTKLKSEGIWFRHVNFIHDEFQTEANLGEGDIVGAIQAESIKLAGEELQTNCPMLGQYKLGRNWLETH